MPRNTDKQARAEAMLGELAELGLGLARELADRLRASKDTDEIAALTGAFDKVSGEVRLTMAARAGVRRGLPAPQPPSPAKEEARGLQLDMPAGGSRVSGKGRPTVH